MKAGKLRHLVGVEEPVEGRSASGAEVLSWNPIGAVWASVEPLSGREPLLGDQITAVVDTRVRMRWSPQLDRMTPKWRLVFRDRYYDIKHVAHIAMANREIEVLCQAGANRG